MAPSLFGTPSRQYEAYPFPANIPESGWDFGTSGKPSPTGQGLLTPGSEALQTWINTSFVGPDAVSPFVSSFGTFGNSGPGYQPQNTAFKTSHSSLPMFGSLSDLNESNAVESRSSSFSSVDSGVSSTSAYDVLDTAQPSRQQDDAQGRFPFPQLPSPPSKSLTIDVGELQRQGPTDGGGDPQQHVTTAGWGAIEPFGPPMQRSSSTMAHLQHHRHHSQPIFPTSIGSQQDQHQFQLFQQQLQYEQQLPHQHLQQHSHQQHGSCVHHPSAQHHQNPRPHYSPYSHRVSTSLSIPSSVAPPSASHQSRRASVAGTVAPRSPSLDVSDISGSSPPLVASLRQVSVSGPAAYRTPASSKMGTVSPPRAVCVTVEASLASTSASESADSSSRSSPSRSSSTTRSPLKPLLPLLAQSSMVHVKEEHHEPAMTTLSLGDDDDLPPLPEDFDSTFADYTDEPSAPTMRGGRQTTPDLSGKEDAWGIGHEAYQKLTPKARKQLRNKIGARRFRERRKEYITTLQAKLIVRDALIKDARGRLARSNQTVKDLRTRVAELEAAASGLTL